MVTRMYAIIVGLLILEFSTSALCLLPETAYTYSACYGTEAENLISSTCSSAPTSSVIAVNAVSAGAKPMIDKCPLMNTANTSTPVSCCEVDTGDCTFGVGDTAYHLFCSALCLLPETAYTYSACYGTEAENLISSTCSNAPTSSVIAVNSVSAGAKPKIDNCPLINSANTSTPVSCCEVDTGDCTFGVGDTAYHLFCSGQETCTQSGVQNHQVTETKCGADWQTTYDTVTNYMSMDYFCVEGSRIKPMCTSVALSSAGPALYLWNSGYPGAIPAAGQPCTCSVETPDCDADITVYYIHTDFTETDGVCEQSLSIRGGGASSNISCQQGPKFAISTETLQSTYIVVSLDNTMTTAAGHFWLGFQASSTSSLTINCPAVEQQGCFKDCTRPVVANGNVTGNTTAGSTVSVSCEPGYILIGADTLTCNPDGTWDTDIPTCDVVSCPALDIDNGVAVGNRTYGATVTVTCDTGYKIAGDADSLTCGADGIWNDTVPVCDVIQLGDPCQTNDDCTAIHSVCDLTTTRTCVCEVGYTVNGEGVCQIDDCGEVVVSNAVVDGNTTYGASVTVTCSVGYQREGVASLTCQAGGTWSDDLPTCNIVDCGAVSVANGRVAGGTTTYGSTVTVTCDTGYMITDGARVLECMANGSWSDVIPSCGLVDCGTPDVDNAVVTGTTTHNSIVTIACNVGYDLHGVHNLTCYADGFWNEDTPTCDIVVCETPVVASAVVSGPTTYSSIVTVSCNSNYEIDGVDNLECRADGSWNNDAPTCRPIRDNNSDIIIIVICVAVGFVAISVAIQIIVYCVCCRKKPKSETKEANDLEASPYVGPQDRKQPEGESPECATKQWHDTSLLPSEPAPLDKTTPATTEYTDNTHVSPHIYTPVDTLTSKPKVTGAVVLQEKTSTNVIQSEQMNMTTADHREFADDTPSPGIENAGALISSGQDTIEPEAFTSPPCSPTIMPPAVAIPSIHKTEPLTDIVDEANHKKKKKKKKKHKKHRRYDTDNTEVNGGIDEQLLDNDIHGFHNRVTPMQTERDHADENRHRKKKKRKHREADDEETSVRPSDDVNMAL